jgi:Trp operon repressor
MNKNIYIKKLAKVISDINNINMAEDFLENILTPNELEEIAQRLEILKLLAKGESQREICEKLGVAVATVGRGSRELKYSKSSFIKTLSWQKSKN